MKQERLHKLKELLHEFTNQTIACIVIIADILAEQFELFLGEVVQRQLIFKQFREL